MARTFDPEDLGLETGAYGELTIGGQSLVSLAHTYGTPLHVVHAARLLQTAERFQQEARHAYAGDVSIHYAMKCNSVPGIVEVIHAAGLNAEVTTGYELELARRVGFQPGQIIVNGPGKSDEFLRSCVQAHVRLVVVDALEELAALEVVSASEGRTTGVLLRINPGYVPRGMNHGSATASRKGCAFGLDLRGGEVEEAFVLLSSRPHLRFHGFHMHIGTGIRSPRAYSGALECLSRLREISRKAGYAVEVLDLGGGIGSPTTRGMTTREMALYEAIGLLPQLMRRQPMPAQANFFKAISESVARAFGDDPLPELILEPGRAITSQNQLLLLTVQGVKRRKGAGTWVTTDGGLSTVCMPTYYECHEVLLCNDVTRPVAGRVTLNGPACFAGDIIYRNKPMPLLQTGEVLAVMDSGAYFTALESSFGFARPAVIAVDGPSVSILRARETFADMVSRDHFHDVLKEAL